MQTKIPLPSLPYSSYLPKELLDDLAEYPNFISMSISEIDDLIEKAKNGDEQCLNVYQKGYYRYLFCRFALLFDIFKSELDVKLSRNFFRGGYFTDVVTSYYVKTVDSFKNPKHLNSEIMFKQLWSLVFDKFNLKDTDYAETLYHHPNQLDRGRKELSDNDDLFEKFAYEVLLPALMYPAVYDQDMPKQRLFKFCLSCLTPSERTLVIEYFLSQRTLEETAQDIGITYKTASYKLCRIYGKLRKELFLLSGKYRKVIDPTIAGRLAKINTGKFLEIKKVFAEVMKLNDKVVWFLQHRSYDNKQSWWDYCCSQLTEKQQQVFMLYYEKKMSHREIAEVVGVAHQNVKSALDKAVKKLLGILFDEPEIRRQIIGMQNPG